jgi:Mrp family chromosome partitioning ATPase
VQRLADSPLFDVVLYDLPPVLGLADASLLARHLDGVLLLVSLGQVPRKRAQAALERLQEARASVLGMITNRLRPSATDADRHPTYRYYTNAAPAGASSDLRERFRRWLEG